MIEVARHDDRRIDPQHRVARPDHPGVSDECRALRQDAGVRGRHMGVAAEDRREAPVEMPAHRELLARRFGVPVEDAHLRRALAQLFQEQVERAERVVLLGHEHATYGVCDERPFRDRPAASRIPRRKVERPHAEVQRIDLLEEDALIPHVVAVRDDVRARFTELGRDLAGEPAAARCVLAVDDREVDPALGTDLWNERRHGLPSGFADDIADEENPHLSRAAR